MLGAIIGDIVGSRWEFQATNDYNFELFSDRNSYTDDTICTIAVADALLRSKDFGLVIHEWCRRYPHPMGGYGGRFRAWVMSENPEPYGSYGNGAAMRVSPVAWFFLNAAGAIHAAALSASCTHNHPEGIKGAQAVVLAIHDCRELHVKYDHIGENEIAEGLKRAIQFGGYNIDINKGDVQNRFDETCQGTVPVAFWIISQSHSFEDAIRRAVSLGADADTLGAIVGSIAEVIWGIPEWMKRKALSYLPEDMKSVLRQFKKRVSGAYPSKQEYENLQQHKAIMFWKLALGNVAKILNGENGMPSKEKVAVSGDWKTEPMPSDDNVSHIVLDIPISAEDMNILRRGHIPEAQEDHWMMECDNEYIRYYRSWTGHCAFEAHYCKKCNEYRIDRLSINKNLVEFGVNGTEPAAYLFRYLVTAEIGADANVAWNMYLDAWETEFYRHRPPMAILKPQYHKPEFTPERIDKLADCEVFVFGSNLAGRHGGGAAYAAYKKFGAIMGQGVGMQGQSYAIPTMQGGVETIRPYVDEFIEYAKAHPKKVFLVTRIGCGIAGFTDEEIAPLFKDALRVPNIVLPQSFTNCLSL